MAFVICWLYRPKSGETFVVYFTYKDNSLKVVLLIVLLEQIHFPANDYCVFSK